MLDFRDSAQEKESCDSDMDVRKCYGFEVLDENWNFGTLVRRQKVAISLGI